MSYTSIQQVRHHLVAPFPVQERVIDQPVILDGTEYVSFFGGAVEQSSLCVKSIQSGAPILTTLILGSGPVAFSSQPVVHGSVVVASDSSLGTVYTENADYVVDYASGNLTPKEGGTLAAEQQVTVWRVPFALYSSGDDYLLRAEQGEIRRLSGGGIAAGERVYLDYSPIHMSFADEIISNAVVTANGMVESEVDPEGRFGADAVLGAAATYRALEIICRAAACRTLAGLAGEDRVALAWIKLAGDYAEKSDSLLRAFRPPYDNPRTPTHS